MFPIAQAIITVASTLISADRMSDTDVQARNVSSGATSQATSGEAIYTRGKSEFATALEQVEPDPVVLNALDKAGKLTTPDTSLDTLIRASAQPSATPASLPSSLASLQQSLQQGGQRVYETARLGINLDTRS
jgi:hypothetical protein